MMESLSLFKGNLLNSRVVLPPTLLVHGKPGLGKSSLGREFPKPLFLMTENAFPYGSDVDALAVRNLDDFHLHLDNLDDFLGSQKRFQQDRGEQVNLSYKTLVIDHVSGLDNFIESEIERVHNVNNIVNIPYGAGFESIARFWDSVNQVVVKGSAKRYYGILPRLEYLQKKYGLCLLFLAHSKTQSISNPGEEPRVMYIPSITKKTESVLNRFVNEIIFISSSYADINGSNKGGFSHLKSTGFIFQCGNGQPNYESKTRCGLPLVLPYLPGEGFKVLSQFLPLW